MKAKKYVIYTRAASVAQGASNPCIKDVERCKELVASIGGNLVDTFIDIGVSGRHGSPAPARDKLMERVKAGGVDYVIVSDLARLSRSASDVMAITAEIKAAGAELAIAHDLGR